MNAQSARSGWVRWVAAVGCGLILVSPAPGFYFDPELPGGPGSPTLIPYNPTTGGNPPYAVTDPPLGGPNPNPNPVPGGGPIGTDPVVPEPGTALLAALGLGVTIVVRRVRQRRL